MELLSLRMVRVFTGLIILLVIGWLGYKLLNDNLPHEVLPRGDYKVTTGDASYIIRDERVVLKQGRIEFKTESNSTVIINPDIREKLSFEKLK